MSYPILKPNSTWFSPNVTTIKRSTIITINIVDTYAPSDTLLDSWDASIAQDGSIMCYVEGTTLTIAGNGSGGIFANANSGFAFSDIDAVDYFTKLTTINGLNLLDTTDAVYMQGMFRKCSALVGVNVSNWNTSKAQSFRGTFRECSALTTLDVSGWDTSNVTDMYTMFYSCSKLDGLDVSNWDVSNVTDMGYMFDRCSAISYLDVSKWDVGNVTTFKQFVYQNSALTSLDVSKWNTSSATDMSYMFYNCANLEALDVSKWNTSNVTSLENMFYGCYKLTELDLSAKPEIGAWDVSKVTTMLTMFGKCWELVKLNMKGWNTCSVTMMSGMFYQCTNLKVIDVSDFDTHNVTDMSQMFKYCYALEEIIGLDKWDTSNLLYLVQTFSSNANYAASHHLKVIDLSSFNTSKVTRMDEMFQNSPDLVSIRFGEGWDTSNVVNMANMFNKCPSLTELDASRWDTTKAENMKNLFNGCNNLRKVILGIKFSFTGNGNTSCALPTPSSEYIDGADGSWYALDGSIYTPENIPNLTAAIYYASGTLSEAARIEIDFNDEKYIVDKSFLSSAIEDLETHFSTVINGVGTTVNFMGAEYGIDSEKLSTATNALISHVAELAGSGKKVKIGGIEYTIDLTKAARTFENLENLFSDLENAFIDSEIIAEPDSNTKDNGSGNKFMSPSIKRPSLVENEFGEPLLVGDIP